MCPDLSMDRSAEPSTVVDAFALACVAELAAKDASGAIVGGATTPVVLVAAARTGATSEFTAPSGLAKRGTSTVKTASSQLASVDAQENSIV